MAKLVSTLFITLDGVAEIDFAWHFPYFDANMGAAVGEDYEDVDVLLLGRATYDSFAGAWPEREAGGGDDAPFAKQLGDVRKVVATRGTQDLGWRNVEVIDGDLVAAVTALKAEDSVNKILIAGSVSIVRQLLSAGLLDELRLLVHPIAARNGTRLFEEGEPMYPFTLLKTESFPTGVVRLVYATADLPAPQSYDEIVDNVPSVE